MFVKRSISLGVGGQEVFSSTLVKRSQIDNTIAATDVMAAAHQQARQIIEAAQGEASAMLDRAEEQAQKNIAAVAQQFQQQLWDKLNEALQQWHQERQRMWDQIEQYAGALLNNALTSVLGSVPAEVQAQAMLTQLSASQRQPENAVLRCSRQLYPAVEQYLQQQNISHWQLQQDPTVAEGLMILVTPSGEFQCSWENIVKQITNGEDGDAVDNDADELLNDTDGNEL